MVAEYFKENTAQLQRGENSYSSGNVKKMVFDPELKPAILKGEVSASMKKRSYNVEMSIDSEDGIIDGKCTCPRGQVICHHMAALCIYAHHNVSITDKACSWNAPKKPETAQDILKLKDIYPPKNKNYCALKEPVSDEAVQAFRNNLMESNTVGYSWLLRSPPVDSVELLPNIEDILFSAEYCEAEDKQHFILNKLALSLEAIVNIASETIGQSTNEKWLLARKLRVTGSKFGIVLSACSRNKYPRSLFVNLMDGYDLENVQAIQWGRQHESVAIQMFEIASNMTVNSTGLWLDSCGFIGASPDGLVNDTAIVEVKCPFRYRHVSLQEALKNDKKYIIYKDEDGNTLLNKSHDYWHQIQGELFLTKRNICYLVVWTPNECEIVEIAKDEDWSENLNILKTFYVEKFIPFVCGQ